MPRSKNIKLPKVKKMCSSDNVEEVDEQEEPILEVKDLSIKTRKSPLKNKESPNIEEIINKKLEERLLEYENKKQEEKKARDIERQKLKEERERLRQERIANKKKEMKTIILDEIALLKPEIQKDLTDSIIKNRINEVSALRNTLFKGTTLRW